MAFRNQNTIKMNKNDFIKEHKNLANLLDTTASNLQKESTEQKQELKKRTNCGSWMEHVKEVRTKNGCSYKEALQLASKTYNK